MNILNVKKLKLNIKTKKMNSYRKYLIDLLLESKPELDKLILYTLSTDKLIRMKNEIILINNKEVNKNSIELDGIEQYDRPDYCDAYIDSAKFIDGTELTNEQCERLTMQYPDLVNGIANKII